MADITAAVVNEFRKRTGLGLMECKAILQEAGGDMARAETLAKERGLKNVEKRAGRGTNAGRIEVAFNADHTAGAMVELNCETDFVARNDAFRQAAKDLAEHMLKAGSFDPETPFSGDTSKTIREVLNDLNARTGENVNLSRAERLEAPGGRVEAYIHHDAKSGAIVAVTGGSAEPLSALAKDLALHAVAARPMRLRREELPEAVVSEQRRIFLLQAPADKPDPIKEKITQGKLEAWYSEVVLTDQVFVKDPAKKVKEVVTAVGKDAAIVAFARFVVGETPE